MSATKKKNEMEEMLELYEWPKDEPARSQRIAHLLNFCAENLPYQFISLTTIQRYANGMTVNPRMPDDVIRGIKGSFCNVKKILLSKYKRGWASQPGVGVRACVDDADVVKKDVAGKATRLQSALVSLSKSVEIVDTKSASYASLDAKTKSWFQKDIKENIDELLEEGAELKLLPIGSPNRIKLEEKE